MYRSILHVSPTSCTCEQTNYQGKIIMNDLRKQKDPSSLELLLLLKFNANIWDVYTIHEILLAHQRRVPIIGGSVASTSSSFSSGFITLSTTHNVFELLKFLLQFLTIFIYLEGMFQHIFNYFVSVKVYSNSRYQYKIIQQLADLKTISKRFFINNALYLVHPALK